jgi:nicotinate-nucleotide--dimethylbenzimidazole phosphoribosyltransferase
MRPFDDIRALLALMPEASEAATTAVAARQLSLTKPAGSLGRLEEIAAFLAGWQDKPSPTIERPQIAIFVANHGIVVRGVSAYPAAVTKAMLENFTSGGAAINQICATYGIGLKLFELALDVPTPDITQGAAFDEASCAATIAFGMEAIAGEADVLGLGEMGIGNTTVAAAIFAALYGGTGADWVGRGTGVDDAGLQRKIAAVDAALSYHAGQLTDPLEILRRLGGREIAALVGAILAARLQRIPVVLDGFVTCAAAAVLHALQPNSIDHCLAGHLSAEQAHRKVLERLGKAPLLNLDLRLGEGSGAALALGIMKATVACLRGMATFDEAKVPTA